MPRDLRRYLPIVVLTLVLLVACSAREPQGPGERIGRSLDELSRGIKELNENWGTPSPTPTARPQYRWQERYNDDYRGDDYRDDQYRDDQRY